MGLFDIFPKQKARNNQTDVYTFFDVETPNRRNDRICSIGLVQTDTNGTVIEKRSYTVDPECRFDDVNMRIHGIAPIDVRGKRTLPELWDDELRDIMSGTRLIAHNAQFDLCVLSKAFEAYDIAHGDPYYADTMVMARDLLSDLPDAKLPTVCKRLGIKLETHHKASCDSDACMGAFWSMANMVEDAEVYFSTYKYEPVDRYANGGQGFRYSDKTKAINALIKMMSGVMSDGVISIGEALGVLTFISIIDDFEDDPTIMTIADTIQKSVSDGSLSPAEANELKALFTKVVDPAQQQEAPSSIEFNNTSFVLTGSFEHGAKSDIEKYITDRGGVVAKGVSKKVGYVVIGGCGSDAYAMGNYGTKVKKAMDLQSKGAEIKIIKESDLFSD